MRPTRIALVLAVALSACAPRAPEPSPGVSAPVPAVLRAHPVFGESDPHDGIGSLPSRYAVHGIDVSRWQTGIDWATARTAGVSFAYIKATEGGDFADPQFRNHWAGAAAAGVRRGAFHYFYFCRPAAEQAAWFIRHVPRAPDALPPVLDLEWNAHSPTCRRRPPRAEVMDEARAFLDIVERHYGKRPIVYTTLDFDRATGLGDLARTQFWLRSVAAPPGETFPGQPWVMWQYTGTGIVPGIAGPVDLNVFRGTVQEWAAWGH